MSDSFVDLEGIRPSGGFTDARLDDPFMPLGGWTWGLVVMNAVVVIFAIAAAAVLLGRDRVDQPAYTAEWYDDAFELTREVTLTARSLRDTAEPDRVARRLLPLPGRIRRHVREAPASVDTGVYRGLFELAMRCQQVAFESPSVDAGGPFLAGRLDSLAEEASSVEARIPPD